MDIDMTPLPEDEQLRIFYKQLKIAQKKYDAAQQQREAHIKSILAAQQQSQFRPENFAQTAAFTSSGSFQFVPGTITNMDDDNDEMECPHMLPEFL